MGAAATARFFSFGPSGKVRTKPATPISTSLLKIQQHKPPFSSLQTSADTISNSLGYPCITCFAQHAHGGEV
jgi:hypothetical protein